MDPPDQQRSRMVPRTASFFTFRLVSTSLGPSSVLARLQASRPLVSVELRPPQAGLPSGRSMDTWIDMHHGVRRLASGDTVIFMTDNAVGQAEEGNLGHFMSNLAGDGTPSKLVPFLSAKHSLECCLMYDARAASHAS